MFAKYLTTSSLIAAMALTPMFAAPAAAQDARDVIGGLLIGGAIGAAIGAASQQTTTRRVIPVHPTPQPGARPAPPRTQPYTPPPQRIVRPSIPATEAGRQVQTALNYFGFNAGYVDGQVGPATRAAVERYQAALGYPVNGRSFPEEQAQYLIGAYLWASNGGQGQTGLNGTPLLVAYRGTLTPTAPAPSYAGQPGGGTTVIVQPGTTTVVPAPGAAPVTTAATSGSGGVPNLFAGATGNPVLSAHCDGVALQGQANGGMMTLGNLSNPAFALSEQFCTARASAVNQGHELTQAINGLTYAQITAQCEAFSTSVAGQTALIGGVAPTQAAGSAQGFAYTSGIPAPELAATARVCLGVGYGADNMDMAMGSALILVATGEPAYAELLGHHLREGFGVGADAHRAHEWYDVAINALQGGATAVFSPTDAGRLPLIRQAVALTVGGGIPTPVPTGAPAPGFTPLPVPTAAPGAAPIFAPQNVQPRPVAVQPQAVTPRPQPNVSPASPVASVTPQPVPVEPQILLEAPRPVEPNIGVTSIAPATN
ncbi:peptidoglycan-binding protein [Gymnodinialimonas sp. 2305UL16-5]|uniref:peptidoglycan-binding domain-containing protein n=1 Tax=Gymnodinialimonas mytili TaxID=3126503 RepID=UPI0030AE4A90